MRFYLDGQKACFFNHFCGFGGRFWTKNVSKKGGVKNARARNHLREKRASLMWLRAAKLETRFARATFLRRVLRFRVALAAGRPPGGKK